MYVNECVHHKNMTIQDACFEAGFTNYANFYRMYKKDGIREGRVKRNIPMGNKDYCAVILCGAALAVGMNNLISLTPLPYLFTGYEETNEVIFGGGLFLQILGGGIFACIVEELSHRGVTYLRMKHYWGKKNAMIFSALVFGIYHFNVVQGIYAFILGLFFVWLYERYDSLWAPIVAHMSANLCVILLGSSEVVTNALSNLVGYSLITCISFLVFFHGWKWMKQSGHAKKNCLSYVTNTIPLTTMLKR